MRSTMDVTKEPPGQPKNSSKSSFFSDFSPNWTLWVLALLFSLLSLQAVPLYKFFMSDDYSARYWFLDVFGSTGIIMISASMTIAVGFEVIAKSKKVDLPGGLIVLLALFCYLEYGIVTVVIEKQTGQSQLELFGKFAKINMAEFCAMFISGLFCFTPLAGILRKKLDAVRKKLSGKSRKGKGK